MHAGERREAFRAVLGGDRCIHPASVFDAISGRIAADLGFETAMFAGSVGSFTVLGAPDLIVLTLTEFADQARRICRGGAPPLMVDADHGYGNALNAMRTVQELEHAGVAAMTLEDTILPRPYGAKGVQVHPLEEGLGKIRAALAAREDPRFVIVARTGAIAVNGVEDTIARGRAYAAAGADAFFLTGTKTRAEVEAVAAAVPVPIILGAIQGDMADRDWLSRTGVRIALQGHQPFSAAVAAIHATLKALREGTKPSDLQGVAPAALMARVTREAEYETWTRDFL